MNLLVAGDHENECWNRKTFVANCALLVSICDSAVKINTANTMSHEDNLKIEFKRWRAVENLTFKINSKALVLCANPWLFVQTHGSQADMPIPGHGKKNMAIVRFKSTHTGSIKYGTRQMTTVHLSAARMGSDMGSLPAAIHTPLEFKHMCTHRQSWMLCIQCHVYMSEVLSKMHVSHNEKHTVHQQA